MESGAPRFRTRDSAESSMVPVCCQSIPRPWTARGHVWRTVRRWLTRWAQPNHLKILMTLPLVHGPHHRSHITRPRVPSGTFAIRLRSSSSCRHIRPSQFHPPLGPCALRGRRPFRPPHPPRLLLVIPHIGAGLDEHCLFLPCWAWMMPACLMQMQHSDMGCALALLRHPASSSVTSYVRRQIAQRGGQNRGPPPPARRLLTSCV